MPVMALSELALKSFLDHHIIQLPGLALEFPGHQLLFMRLFQFAEVCRHQHISKIVLIA